MFPRRQRLSRDDFKGLGASRRLSSAHFTLALPRKGEGYAVVVGKGALRLSTARHKLKRRVQAALRSMTLPKALVVFPKAGAAKLTSADLRTELRDLILRVSR